MNMISRRHQWVLDATDHAGHCNIDATVECYVDAGKLWNRLMKEVLCFFIEL